MAPKKSADDDPAAIAKRSADLLWGGADADRPARGPKPRISLGAIVEAGIRIADADGLNAVSMQRVAAEFGFTTMSLYRYVPGKNELIALMVDTAIGSAPDLGADGWRAALRNWAIATWDVFSRHPWFLEAAFGSMMGPNQLGWLEAAVAAVAPSGLSGPDLMDAVLVVNGHVRSMAPFHIAARAEQKPAALPNDEWDSAIIGLITGNSERFPALTAAIRDGAFGPDDESQGFEFGLERILDGIDAYLNAR